MSPNVANVVMVPIGWLIWYRKISVLEMIKIIVIRGKFLVGFSSLRGIIKGRALFKDTIVIKYKTNMIIENLSNERNK